VPARDSTVHASSSAPAAALASPHPTASGLGSSVPSAAATAASVASEYRFESTRLDLAVSGNRCSLTFVGGSVHTVSLDLTPPCYLLIWNQPPPRLANGRAESGGQPVGSQGDAMAWKYSTAGDAKVIAVIGDSVADSLRRGALFKTRQAQNYRCAGSLQGVKIGSGAPVTTPKRHQTGVFCVEAGLDEKDFWMLAHDKGP